MSFKQEIHHVLFAAVADAGYGEFVTDIMLEKPRLKEHGDLATPLALSLARACKKNPMQIAEDIAAAASFPATMVARCEVARPGYLNLHLAKEVLARNLEDIRAAGDDYGRGDAGAGVRCQVEYVSANPTGPLVIVSARAAAVGSAIVNLLRWSGFEAHGEYYVNDYGNQVRALGESLRYRVRERRGKLPAEAEIGAYPGDYLRDIAAGVDDADADRWEMEPDGGIGRYGECAIEILVSSIKADLERFGVTFDNFFRESTLHPGAIEAVRELIESTGHGYTREGALYFRTTSFGDDKDRVLVKGDGLPTYFLGDIAYHRNKFDRGYDWVLDLLGPDHHGHVPRMKAAAAVIGAGPDWFNALMVGWVRLMEGDKPVSMSKRAGEIILMRDLIDDVGVDVAKYFFLMRRANSPLDFDLELARKQSDENPVYYVQYAHARIASVARFAISQGFERRDEVHYALLDSSEERDLLVHLLFFPYVVEGAAMAREPHRLTTYAQELATFFHRFYHERRVITDDVQLSNARLHLVEATQQVLRNVLTILGVSAPASM